ncbi:MAG: uracil-xanthine permease [Oscillospiraceae bacterium]|nr:uracil-xanthine permease [Oscillospiraceae bacterium]
MKLTYGISDRPKPGQLIVFAIQQLLAILAATIAVPAVINQNVASVAANGGMSQSAALFGAGVGTIVYLLFTKFKSPVFLGSSFAFIGSMIAAFAGGVSMSVGYLGLIIGAVMAGLVYVVLAVIVKFAGVAWISKLMPAVVIGPTVAIIGLSLASSAVGSSLGNIETVEDKYVMTTKGIICLICALITLFAVVISSVYGKKMAKLIPFIIGIACGYVVATVFTLIGMATGNEQLLIVDFSLFSSMQWYPDFTFLKAFSGSYDFGEVGNIGAYLGTIAVAYVPVALVVFAEHIADHKNLSTIIDHDLLEDPGLSRTLLGDGVGSMAGAIFGGCPNTTYGESVGCVAITGNASVVTILATAIIAIAISFFAPFVTLLATIPSCVMGGVCITLYGFIAVSGLKMIQSVDLGENKNIFTVSVILICGIGGMELTFGSVTITSIACALILGIIVNLVLSKKSEKTDKSDK